MIVVISTEEDKTHTMRMYSDGNFIVRFLEIKYMCKKYIMSFYLNIHSHV